MAQGQDIEAAGYNVIRNKINLIMGSGIGQLGYGQTVYSSDVAESQQITAQQWNLLRFDLFNARVHQDGTSPTIVQANTGSVITFGSSHPNNQYNTQANIATANKFSIGPGQFAIDAGASASRTTSWSNSLSCTCTVSFGSPDQARWFFNSGGKIRFNSSRTGGAATAQNQFWSSLLSSLGTIEFGANTSSMNFYNLTNSSQIFFDSSVGSTYSSTSYAYSANLFRLSAQCNVADNSNGGASVILFTVSWQDIYVDSGPSPPPDLVDGTLSLSVTELRASGVLQNGTSTPGIFAIIRPTYSITAIVGS
jgi:hypothetical protein